MAVVATTLVSEARSKMLAVVTSGEAGSYVKRPRALWATSSPPNVTASEQAGKASSGDGLFQDAEGAAKAVILRAKGCARGRKNRTLGWAASGSRVFCELMGL